MRKVEKQIINALQNNQNITVGNTSVRNGSVFLHGNEIFRLTHDRAMFNFCGWVTTTTRSRISQLLQTFSNGSVSIKNATPMLHLNNTSSPTASNTWIVLSRKS